MRYYVKFKDSSDLVKIITVRLQKATNMADLSCFNLYMCGSLEKAFSFNKLYK